MKVSIDPATCTGHGLCYLSAPRVFSDDEAGYGQVLGDGEVSAGDADDALRAAANCPERAVTTSG
ncbi:MAG TPA: ferredoxin [Trebonia sp.]